MRAIAVVLLLAIPGVSVAAGYERVEFPSRDAAGTRLTGYLFRPDIGGRRPAVVLLHGCNGLLARDGNLGARERDWGSRFAADGYVALAVDSFNPRGVPQVCTLRERSVSFEDDRPRDAYGARAWLADQPFVASDRIAMVGFSHGAMSTLAAVATSRSERGFRAAIAFYPGCDAIGRRRDPPWTPYAATLMLVGLADDWTPAKPCLAMAERAGTAGAPLELVSYEGARHGFDSTSGRVRTLTVPRRTAKGGEREVSVGGDPVARADSIARVRAFLARELGG